MPFLQTTFLNNTTLQWLTALLVIIAVMIGLRVLRFVILQRVRQLAARTANRVDDLVLDVLDNTKPYLVFFMALYLGTLPLVLAVEASLVLRTLAITALIIQAALWSNRVITFLLTTYIRDRADDAVSGETAFTALNFISRLILWSLVVLLVLDNIPGVEITSLITGLGITGVAVALAVQTILGDLFASLSIVFDHPFVIGDSIVVGDFRGTVEHIGLKTTRLRSLDGEELIFSNSDLLSSRIQNYKKMDERRVVTRLGVAYETPYETLEAIPGMLQAVVEGVDEVRFGRAHLKTLGDSTLIYELVYYVTVPDYNVYMDRQQEVNLGILRRMAEAGVDMPYPTQHVLVESLRGQ